MSYFNFNGFNIYYERHGNENNAKLVILNGIMMNTSSWESFIPKLIDHFEVILIDLLDQGRSDEYIDSYDLNIQKEVVIQLLRELSISEINLMGISYGGEVAMCIAIDNSDMINRLILANTTAATDNRLRDIGESWKVAARSYEAVTFFNTTLPMIYSNDFYNKHYEWIEDRINTFSRVLDNNWYDRFVRLVDSANNHDVNPGLDEISSKTLIIGSDCDYITPIDKQKTINEAVNDSIMIELKGCGHASVYEKNEEFLSVILGFLKL